VLVLGERVRVRHPFPIKERPYVGAPIIRRAPETIGRRLWIHKR
jgi:hypothetical protein